MYKGATNGEVGGSGPPKFGRTTPTFYVAADCSARNWVCHPYFVLYNNLDQGIGPRNYGNVVAPVDMYRRPCGMVVSARGQLA